MRRFVVLMALSVWACGDGTGPGGDDAARLAIQVRAEGGASAALSFTEAWIQLSGPTSASRSASPGESVTFGDLQPGSYTVRLEGRSGSLVDSYGQTSVSVVAGESRTARLTVSGFAPGGLSAGSASIVFGQSALLNWSPVSGAAGYEVQWAGDAAFASSVGSATVDNASYSFSPNDIGEYYFRVRARSSLGNRYSDWSALASPVLVDDPESSSVVAVLERSNGAAAQGELHLQGEGRDLTLPTSADGRATFQSLARGEYTVSLVTPPLGFAGGSQNVSVGPGEQVEARFEGPTVGGVSGTASVEGTGLPGVTVTLDPGGRTAVSDAAGAFSFADVLEGSYTVSLSDLPADAVFGSSSEFVSVTPNDPFPSADFDGQWIRTSAILVTVRGSDGSGVVTNVRVVGLGVDQTLGTDSQGTVGFTGLRAGTYTVSLPSPPSGFDGSSASQDVTVAVGESRSVDFLAGATGTITGVVRVEGSPLPGVSVQLTGSGGFTPRLTSTAADGSYSFSGVPEGTYTVQLLNLPGNVVFASTSRSATVTPIGQSVTVDFGGQYVRTASISVRVIRTDGSGVVTSVRLQGEGEDRVLNTDALGDLVFSSLKAGDYTVTLTSPPTGFENVPASQSVSVATGQTAQVDFVGEVVVLPPSLAVDVTKGGLPTSSPLGGVVDVEIDVVRNGSTVTDVELWIFDPRTNAQYRIASQSLQIGSTPEQFSVSLPWNTAARRTRSGSHGTYEIRNPSTGVFEAIGPDALKPHRPLFINGSWDVVGVAQTVEFGPQVWVVASGISNSDGVVATVTSDNTDINDPTTGQPYPNALAPSGLTWLSGDVYLTLYPVLYSRSFPFLDPNTAGIVHMSMALAGFRYGSDVLIGGSQLTSPNADGSFTFTLCEHGGQVSTAGSPCYASIEDLNTGLLGGRGLAVTSQDEFGQSGPDEAGLVEVTLFNTSVGAGPSALENVLRIDNEGPGGTSDDGPFVHPAIDRNGTPWSDPTILGLVGTPIFGIGIPASGGTTDRFGN